MERRAGHATRNNGSSWLPLKASPASLPSGTIGSGDGFSETVAKPVWHLESLPHRRPGATAVTEVPLLTAALLSVQDET